jgi:hypothetical protein
MKTRNGIYYDLTLSTYKFKVPDTNITFVFSSDLHMMKFEDQYKANRNDHNLKLKARFRINVDMKVMPDVLLYKKIETRGFLMVNEGGHRICQEQLILIGEKATLKN